MATLGATIGAGGLGKLILSGINMRHWNKVIIGTVLCAIVAFCIIYYFSKAGRQSQKKSTR